MEEVAASNSALRPSGQRSVSSRLRPRSGPPSHFEGRREEASECRAAPRPKSEGSCSPWAPNPPLSAPACRDSLLSLA